MAQITFIEHDGTPHTVEVPDGTSLMQGAVSHNVPGIDADCGGAMSCGTCMVHIPPEWQEKTGACSDLEKQMLELSVGDPGNARLSCQMIVKPEWTGMCVNLPESQG